MHPLEQQVNTIRRTARTWWMLYGVGCVVAVSLGVALVLGGVDFTFRSQDRGVRIIASLALFSVAAWSVWRFLLPVIARRASVNSIAQQIEIRFPVLRQRLSSSLEFLHQTEDDPVAGSAAMRRAVIAETESELSQLRLADALDRRLPARALLAAGAMVTIMALVALLAPRSFGVAGRRLLIPWGSNAWHRLKIVDAPQRLAAGQDFEVAVIDGNGQLPDTVTIQYWFDRDDQDAAHSSPMNLVGDRMVHRLNNVASSFQYRVFGGDDHSMEWTRLTVVEPPRWESLTTILHPPAYTGWQPIESVSHIRALNGTRIELSGVVDRPLTAARIHVESDGQHSVYDAEMDESGLRFRLSSNAENGWQIADSGAYWIELADNQLVRGADQRWEVQAVIHRPPTVTLDELPTVDHVTEHAVVPIRISAKDDLAVQRVDLVYSRSDQSDLGEQSVELYRGPEIPVNAGRSFEEALDQGDVREVEFAWDLAKEQELGPGTQLTVHALAINYQPLIGQSTSRRLQVISVDDLLDRIGKRQQFIIGQLAEVLEKQRDAHTQTAAVQVQLRTVGQLTKQDIDHLQSGEMTQREVKRLLSEPHDGIAAQVNDLLQDLHNNRVENGELLRRMEGVVEVIHALAKEPLPAIEGHLIDALKIARSAHRESTNAEENPPSIDDVADDSGQLELDAALGDAANRQSDVISTLEKMMVDLTQWDSYRRFERDIVRLRRDQADVQLQTDEIGGRTMLKDADELTAQEQADLGKLALRQLELARRLDKIQQRMELIHAELEQSDHSAAETIADALDVARRLAISGQMRKSGNRVEQNHVNLASQQQDAILAGLEEVLDVLANRGERELSRLLEKLRAAASELDGLRRQHKQLQEKTIEAAADPSPEEQGRRLERLQKQRGQLQEETQRLARKLQRLQAERAAASLEEVAGSLAGEGQGDQPEGQPDGADDPRQRDLEAEQDLERAEQQLQERIRQAERDLLDEQLARLEQTLEAQISQQLHILDETRRMDGLWQSAGSFTRGQVATVRSLAQQQRSLIVESNDFAEKIEQARVFRLGLIGAVRDMSRAARRLEDQTVDPETQRAESNALARLQQLATALSPDDQPEPPDDGGGGAGGGGQTPQGDGIARLAELKLLKLLQEAVHVRTVELEQAVHDSGGLTPDQEQELANLAVEQGELAELVYNFITAEDQVPEEVEE